MFHRYQRISISFSFLKASDKEQNYKDMKSIFNYGFNNYSFIDLYNTNEKVATYYITNNERIPLFVNETIKYVTEKGNEDNLNYNLKIKDDDLSNKSFKKGEKILDGTIYVNNQEYIDVDLYAGESRDLRISSESSSDITKTTHKEEVNENKEEKNDRSNFAKIGILGIMVFIALRIRRKIILKRIKRKKMLMRKKKIMRNINKRKI